MTSEELRIVQARMGVSGVQLAKWLETTPLCVTRWRTATTRIPGPASVAIRALASGWRP